MSEPDNKAETGFLSRWSQRKRAASLPDATDEPAPTEVENKASVAPPAESEANEEFDFSKLPKLEEINGTTDITDFLRKGVPESVRNAALRKSWALDPAIRNYVNPALDYAYDWNTPGGVPGNSELAAGTDIAKMVLQIMGSGSTEEAVAQPAEVDAALAHSDAPASSRSLPADAAVRQPDPELGTQQVRLSPAAADIPFSASAMPPIVEHPLPDETSAAQQPPRRHGSAKPSI